MSTTHSLNPPVPLWHRPSHRRPSRGVAARDSAEQPPVDMRNHSPLIYFWPVWLLVLCRPDLPRGHAVRSRPQPHQDEEAEDGSSGSAAIRPRRTSRKRCSEVGRDAATAADDAPPLPSPPSCSSSAGALAHGHVPAGPDCNHTVALLAPIVYLLGWLDDIFAAGQP